MTYVAPTKVLTSGSNIPGDCSSRNRGSCPCRFRGVDLLLYQEVVQKASERGRAITAGRNEDSRGG